MTCESTATIPSRRREQISQSKLSHDTKKRVLNTSNPFTTFNDTPTLGPRRTDQRECCGLLGNCYFRVKPTLVDRDKNTRYGNTYSSALPLRGVHTKFYNNMNHQPPTLEEPTTSHSLTNSHPCVHSKDLRANRF